MNESFGPHLTIDAKKCNIAKLKDFNFVFDVLDQLPAKIGMTKITQPYVFKYSGIVPEDAGITGVVIIAESHISIHTFPYKDYVFIDVFSCKNFNTQKAVKLLIDAFESKEADIKVVRRGLDFPRPEKQKEKVMAVVN